jgi:hypothetical protein
MSGHGPSDEFFDLTGCSAISRQSGRLGERQPGPCSADAPDMDQMRHALC